MERKTAWAIMNDSLVYTVQESLAREIEIDNHTHHQCFIQHIQVKPIARGIKPSEVAFTYRIKRFGTRQLAFNTSNTCLLA